MFLKDFTRTATPHSFRPVLPALAATGLTCATLVETAEAWQPAGDLRIGARVQTLDGGLATVRGIERTPATGLPAVRLAGGLVGNCADLVLPRGQLMLVDTLGDSALPDRDLVLVPAAAWLGLPGAAETLIQDTLVTPLFDDEEVIWANSGVLLHCPAIAGTHMEDSFFPTLPLPQARAFLTRRWARLA